jgi:hypothetical protein
VDAAKAFAFADLLSAGLLRKGGPSAVSDPDKEAVAALFRKIGVFHDGGDFHRWWTYGVDQGIQNMDKRELTTELSAALTAHLSPSIRKKYKEHCDTREMQRRPSEVVAHVLDNEECPDLVRYTDHLAEQKLELTYNCSSVALAELVFWLVTNYSSETPHMDQIERMVLGGQTTVEIWCPPDTSDIQRDFFDRIELPGLLSQRKETYKVDDQVLRDQALIGLPRQLLRKLLWQEKDQWLEDVTYKAVKEAAILVWDANREHHHKWSVSKYQGPHKKQLVRDVDLYSARSSEVLLGGTVCDSDVLVGQHAGGCFNCKDPGHQLADCPHPRAPKDCWNCGKAGHLSRDCPDPETQESLKARKDNAQCHHCGEKGHIARYCPKKDGKEVKFAAASGENANDKPDGVEEHAVVDLSGTYDLFGGGDFEPIGDLQRKNQMDFYRKVPCAETHCSKCKVASHNDLTCFNQLAAKYNMLQDKRIKGSKRRLYRLLGYCLSDLLLHSHGIDSPNSRSRDPEVKKRLLDRIKKVKEVLAARAAGGS